MFIVLAGRCEGKMTDDACLLAEGSAMLIVFQIHTLYSNTSRSNVTVQSFCFSRDFFILSSKSVLSRVDEVIVPPGVLGGKRLPVWRRL